MSKFLGSSIVSFENSAQFGGGSSEVSFSVDLVDCGGISGDTFTPPSIGAPVLFEYESFEYFGLTDRYSSSSSMSAYPQYTVHLTNGLFLLQGTKLILNDYYGTSNAIPNLVNVFGYLENSGGFGASRVNDAGISWNMVASGVNVICNTVAGTPYGGPISHKSYKYGIDISALPAIPNYYRINNDSVSLLEFIQEVCEAGGHDFFINLEQTATSGLAGKFKLYTVSRLDEPTPGKIYDFINSVQCVTQKEIGQELRKDATSKFVVGAPVERMWYIEPNTSGSESGGITSAEYAGYNVLPYFGTDLDGNYIVGYSYEDEPDEYYFDIDIRDIGHPNLGDTYSTSEKELKAARKSREAWEIFLGKVSCNKYKILPATGCGSSILARPFVSPVPTGKNLRPMDPTGEYGDVHYGYNLTAIPKFGYEFLASKDWYDSRVLLTSSGLASHTYYYAPSFSGVYPLDSFAATGCNINSQKGDGPATPTQTQFNLYYPSTEIENPYYLRAFQIGTVAPNMVQFARMFESDLYDKTVDSGVPLAHREYFTNIYNAFKSTLGSDQFSTCLLDSYNINISNRRPEVDGINTKKADELYRKIKDLADNYYGKRYMVLIPTIYGAREPESGKLRLSQTPTDAGYLDSAVWDTAYASGLIPEISGLNMLLTPEEKFYPYIKINEAVILNTGGLVQDVQYNYSNISPGDRYLGNPQDYSYYEVATTGMETGTSLDLWVKCGVSERVVYMDNTTLLLPRAIVELPGAIEDNPMGNYGAVQQLYDSIINNAMGPAGAFAADTAFSSGEVSRLVNVLGIDESNQNNGADPIDPDMFAVPLKSNLLCYGPWYLAGANGPIEYERNEDLAPWNYGGYAALDAAGFARVTDGVTNQTFDETGSVTVPGAPLLGVGNQIITGGPYITDISVSVSNGGVSTQYTFQSWSSQRRLSKLTNFNSERIKRLSQVSKDLRRSYREGVGNGIWRNPVDFFNDLKGRFTSLEDLPKRERSSTSHKVISAEVDGYSTVVVSQPGYNAASQAENNFHNKAVMSLDGLFRPYSNLPHDKMSSLTMPEDTGAINTSLDLYPLRIGHDISLLSGDNETEEAGSKGLNGFNTEVHVDSTGVPQFRGIALKGPIMIQGWGRDINGDPVPLYIDESGDPVLTGSGHPYGIGEKQFAPDYLYNAKNHKTGPLDARWDESRGVWAAAGSTKVYLSKITNTYNPSNYSYEVERSNSRSQFTRNAPESMLTVDTTGAIYDPEYVAYTGNPANTGTYELLNYAGIDFPYYEAFVIRETTDRVGSDYYNIWSEDCQDCGHVSNPCGSGYGHGASSIRKKILIENPLKQSLDTGDLAFTTDTGRSKRVNTGSFVGGSGVGASGHIVTNSGGYSSFVVDSSGSDYTYGGFGIVSSQNLCASVALYFTGGQLSSGVVTPAGGFTPSQNYSVSIYPNNATVDTESLPIHWILQAEFKTQQVISHVECENGIMQTCSVKVQHQGAKSCEFCGTSDTLLGSF